MRYKSRIDNEVYASFQDAAGEYLRCWGNGGGCYSLETVLKEVVAPDKKSWLQKARELIKNYGWCCSNGGIDALLSAIDSDIIELGSNKKLKKKGGRYGDRSKKSR